MADQNYIIILSDEELTVILRVLQKHKERLEKLIDSAPNHPQVEDRMMLMARMRPIVQTLFTQRATQRDEADNPN